MINRYLLGHAEMMEESGLCFLGTLSFPHHAWLIFFVGTSGDRSILGTGPLSGFFKAVIGRVTRKAS